MKLWIALGCGVLALMGTGCGSEAEDTPALEGAWVYTNTAGTAGIGLDFAADGTYVAQFLRLTSETTGDADVETGRYQATATTITYTPEQSTCADATGAAETQSYKLQNGGLTLVLPSGVLAFQRNTAPASSNFVVRFGCTKNGVFTPSPLVPIAR